MFLTEFLRKGKYLCLSIAMIALSAKGYSQDPGGNPDGPPPAVPFNDYYYFILIAIGVVFALFVIKRMRRHSTH